MDMNKVVVASLRKSAGKTSFVVGLIQAQRKSIGYMKPFGDRLLYRKKRLWDYDSALIANVFGLEEEPENITIAFEHSKVKYMYDEEGIKKKLLEMAAQTGESKNLLIVEGGRDLTYGGSVHLDAVSVAQYMDANLLVLVSGDSESIVDDITFVKKYVDLKGVNFGGVVINKVKDIKDFTDTYLNTVTELGIPVKGVIPYKEELTHLSVGYLSEFLFAKVLAGEGGMNNVVKNIFVGALSANAALRNPLFKKGNKLIITGGDRTDMILAALESDTAGIVLTNNILPPSNVISTAKEHDIPLLLVSSDTYQTAKHIDDLEPLLTKDDSEKVELLGRLVKEHVAVEEI